MANEKRLIDATPLIDECHECMSIEWNKSVYTTWAEAEEDFMQRLLDAPTVDAVEVVPCIKCKHYDPESEYCQFWHGVRHPGHYCGDGDNHEQG